MRHWGRAHARYLVHGETNRLINTNSSASSLSKHLNFFCDRLAERGYSRAEVRVSMQQALHLARTRHVRAQSRTHMARERKHHVSLIYSRTTNYSMVRKAISKYRHTIGYLGHVGVSSRTQQNLFRSMYRANWPTIWPSNCREHRQGAWGSLI